MATSTNGEKAGKYFDELKTNVEKGTGIIKNFETSVKVSIGVTVEEFTKMRDEMKKMGIGFEALEKLTLQMQESYNDEIKKIQEQKEAALKASNNATLNIHLDYLNEYLKLTDHGRKEVDLEKYQELLKKKEDALAAHHLK